MTLLKVVFELLKLKGELVLYTVGFIVFVLILLLKPEVPLKKVEKKDTKTYITNVDSCDISQPTEIIALPDGTVVDTTIIYAGRYDEAPESQMNDLELYHGTDSIYKIYRWNGEPRDRKWLTHNEWTGNHCTNRHMRKSFKEWKSNQIELFINFMCSAAVDECKLYTDIPPELIVAQSILESNFGKSRLSVQGNNLFGHKYRGKNKHMFLIAHDDTPTDKFTKYKSHWFSLRNHSKILMSRYRSRIKGEPTLNKWLYALCGGMTVEQSKKFRSSGGTVYATSCMTEVCYSQKLKNVINYYSLTERCSNLKKEGNV